MSREVTELPVVEPSGGARKLASKRSSTSPIPVQFVGLDGQDLPLADSSVDHVLVTWTLWSIPNVERALTEIRRVLLPGGATQFAEHGQSPRPGIVRWQDALTPVWSKLAGGCDLNRSVGQLITSAGFTIDRLETDQIPWSGPFGFMYEGIAVNQAPRPLSTVNGN